MRVSWMLIITSKPESRPEHGVDLEVEVARGLRLKNPVLTASGTFGHGDEVARLGDPSRLGAVTAKSISPEPWAGNPAPRLAETGQYSVPCWCPCHTRRARRTPSRERP